MDEAGESLLANISLAPHVGIVSIRGGFQLPTTRRLWQARRSPKFVRNESAVILSRAPNHFRGSDDREKNPMPSWDGLDGGFPKELAGRRDCGGPTSRQAIEQEA